MYYFPLGINVLRSYEKTIINCIKSFPKKLTGFPQTLFSQMNAKNITRYFPVKQIYVELILVRQLKIDKFSIVF